LRERLSATKAASGEEALAIGENARLPALLGAYSAAKHGAEVFSESLRRELQRKRRAEPTLRTTAL